MMRGLTYCRVSTKEQMSNLSLPTQGKACRDYCRRNGIEVVEEFIEKGESAKTTNRTEFKRLISYCHEHKGTVDCLVVYSLSRFSRDVADHHAVKAVLNGLGVELRSVTEPIDDTSSGKLMENVIASFAQFDNDVKSERTKVGMKAALKRGRWTFGPPIGYLKPPGYAGGPSLVPDPERADLIRLMFEMCSTGGHSQAQILRAATARGLCTAKGKALGPERVSRILRNPLYSGWIILPNWQISCPGDFDALVTEEIFQRAQLALSKGQKASRTTGSGIRTSL